MPFQALNKITSKIPIRQSPWMSILWSHKIEEDKKLRIAYQNMDLKMSNYDVEDMNRLAGDFQPNEWDVICARGKDVYESAGNKNFRELVKEQVHTFAAATTKVDKGKVVSFILNTIRSHGNAGFVKQVDGVWYEVGDRNSREKIGQQFRDLLHNR